MKITAKKTVASKAKSIKFILLDVDGVLTDGGIYYTARGVEMKRFNAQDGYGIARARDSGITFGLISGRDTPVVTRRAKDLKITEIHQGRLDKLNVLREIQERFQFADAEFCFMGDDLFDLPLLNQVGFSAAPANARPEVKKGVDYVCHANGGDGAVRELVDLILSCQGK
jgi:3-deoxy-D-manno-octulosonate 8-phosphate phosphatase (KDO 8-P phosphatase)